MTMCPPPPSMHHPGNRRKHPIHAMAASATDCGSAPQIRSTPTQIILGRSRATGATLAINPQRNKVATCASKGCLTARYGHDDGRIGPHEYACLPGSGNARTCRCEVHRAAGVREPRWRGARPRHRPRGHLLGLDVSVSPPESIAERDRQSGGRRANSRRSARVAGTSSSGRNERTDREYLRAAGKAGRLIRGPHRDDG
jgi:hypothetical protein